MAYMYTLVVTFIGLLLIVIVLWRSWWPTSAVKIELVQDKILKLLMEKGEMTDEELKEAFMSGFPQGDWSDIANALAWIAGRWTGYRVAYRLENVPGSDKQIRKYYIRDNWPDLPTTLLPYD